MASQTPFLPAHFRNGVPAHMAHVVSRFKASLTFRDQCYFCQKLYTARSRGSLSCRYHPLSLINRGTNLMGGYSELHPPMLSCRICASLHLSASAQAPDMRAPHGIANAGCTRIDHCSSPDEIFERPFIALPTVFLDELDLTLNARSATPAMDNDAVLDTLQKHSNVLVIYKARHFERIVEIDIPGTAGTFKVAVRDIYEAMAAQFGFESIEEEVKAARAVDPMARAAMHNDQYAHIDARRKDRLRTQFLKKVLFVPFVVVARIDQTTPGSKGIRLLKKHDNL